MLINILEKIPILLLPRRWGGKQKLWWFVFMWRIDFFFLSSMCPVSKSSNKKITCISGNYESKRQRKPTKKLLESNDLDPGFMPKKGDLGLSKKVCYFSAF